MDRVAIGKVASVRSGYAFKSSDWLGAGVPVIKIKNVKAGWVTIEGCSFVSEEVAKEAYDFELRRGDILISMTGNVGEVAKVRDEGRMLLNQRVGRFSVRDPKRLHREFLFFCLQDCELKQSMVDYAYGAAQPNISPTLIEQQEIPLPALAVQRRIAGILSAYDELMENCQRRIRILEEMARALYREWFVHFRFPGHEKVPRAKSPLGEMPQGWEVRKLGKIAENFDRLRKPLSKMQRAEIQGEYPYYGAAKVFDHINDFIFDGEYLLMAEDGSVITPERAPVLQLVNEKFWPNNHTHVLRGKPPFSTHFLYLGLSDVDISPYITGAAQPKITQENMNRIPFYCGPEKVHQEFDRLVAPMIRQSQILQRQIGNLRRTRDLLLPRLLSGQVSLDVSAVEDVAEPAAPAPPLSQTDLASEEPVLRAAEEAPPYRVERAGHGLPPPAEPADEAPVPINQIDRTEVLQVIRQVFSEGPPRERDAAIRDVARALGYRRTGARIHEILQTDLMTAVRRCILENDGGTLRLCARSITDYDRDFLKQQFLAAIGRTWIDRDTATRDFCRWLGFARTGPVIEDTARSLINGLLRQERLETDGVLIRRV